MDKDTFWMVVDKLGIHFTSLNAEQKESYFDHLRNYSNAEMVKASRALIASRRWRSFPSVAEIRDVMDKVRFDNRAEPTAEELADPYGQFPCSSCEGTGYIIEDNLSYRPGQSGSIAKFCQCHKGQKKKAGREKYQEDKKKKRYMHFERRYEPEEERP